jgi:mediator of RNA polymerase II transcription subunit 14
VPRLPRAAIEPAKKQSESGKLDLVLDEEALRETPCAGSVQAQSLPDASTNGYKMNGLTNGLSKPLSNGVLPAMSQATGKSAENGLGSPSDHQEHQINGDRLDYAPTTRDLARLNGFSQMPPEIQHITQGYLRLSRLIERSAQECWDGLADVVEKLFEIELSPQPQTAPASQTKIQANGTPFGDQSKENLNKKDRLLSFAQDQRANFIKLLVLSQWGKNARDIQKVIDLHSWIVGQRIQYTAAADFVGFMKRDLGLAQIPNPDLKTALEVLSMQRVSSFPNLGYAAEKKLKPKHMLKTLRWINNILCSRLTLHESLPSRFHNYKVHNGRVTFSVASEFEVDLSIADDDPASQFYFVDFRFTFEPCNNTFNGRLHDDIASRANDILKYTGLVGIYDFLHDLTLSHKINILHKQARELAWGRWSENLRVELIHRTLVVEYWTNRPGGKSWVEIGIKRERRNKDASSSEKNADLHIRWIRDSKPIEDIDIQLDVQALSVEDILHQATAMHASRILDSIYNNLLKSRLYGSGQLSLELSTSFFEPQDCQLQLQFTRPKQVVVALKAISGAVVLRPASARFGRAENELARSKNVVDEATEKILHLCCITAEQDLSSAASSVGWEICRAFRPSATELKALFNGHALKHSFFRWASWESGFILAATPGLGSDRYCLVHAEDLKSQVPSPLVATSFLTCNTSLTSDAPYDELSTLARYTSGLITLKTNASHLESLSVRKVLPPIPAFVPGYRLPDLSFEFHSAELRHISEEVSTPIDWTQDLLKLEHPMIPKETWIRHTISISFSSLHSDTQEAIVVARGRSNAAFDVLKYIKASTSDPTIKLHPPTGDFSFMLMSPVGKPIINQLLDRLFQLETLLACVTIIKKHTSMTINSISPLHTAFLYGKSPPTDLGVVINFATSIKSLQLEFTPHNANPHNRIREQLRRHLAKRSDPLHFNLSTFIPLLACSLPLLTLFDELQARQDPSSPHYAAPASKVSPSVHILVRDPKMYGIQYFGPSSASEPESATSDSPSIMLARFEILLSAHRTGVIWILRPAIEEYESYNRKSYCSQELKDRLRADVFGRRNPDQGWQGLDTGASCPIEQPEKLLRKVDEVIRAWVREASQKGLKNAEHLNGENDDMADQSPIKNEQNAQAQAKSKNRQTGSNSEQKAKPGGPGNGKANGVAAGGKSNTQGAKEVITLD